ncbi:MAG: isoprenyl transferase [Oscillospiraceae bacterium]|nr:isoprenyl transferase [Oscillospiraceae bacterium]
MLKKKSENRVLPVHIAVIMDGNGRWAKKRGLPRSAGHSVGARAFKNIARYCNKIGIKYLTAYAFSTENWKRPPEEISAIMNILRDYLKDAKNFKADNIQVKFLGDRARLPEDIRILMKEAEEGSADATGLKLSIAVNYGGRGELVAAAKILAKKAKDGVIDPENIDEAALGGQLYTAGQPDPDILIRPGGEKRVSNFLTWQTAYSELIFFDVLWPDFAPKHIEQAIGLYNERERRYGAIV